MGVFTAAAIVGSLVLGAASVAQQQKAGRAASRAADAQQQQNDLASARSARQALRQAQVARASTIATGIASGGGGGSGLAGAQASIQSQLGEILGYQSQMNALSGVITSQNKAAAQAEQNAKMFGSFSSIGFDIARAGSFQAYFTGQRPTAVLNTSQ